MVVVPAQVGATSQDRTVFVIFQNRSVTIPARQDASSAQRTTVIR